MNCPSCRRPVAVARPQCLYCGAALPVAAVEAAKASAAEVAHAAAAPAARGDRVLIVVDVTGAETRTVSRALGLSSYEASQRVRRGGLQLLRLADAETAAKEAERLGRDGLHVARLDERAVLDASRPVLAMGGRRDDAGLDLATAAGRVRIEPGDLVLVVKGPITRENQTRDLKKALAMAVPERGYRFHLHRLSDPRPVELDPDAFELPAATPQSSLLVLTEWVSAVAQGVPVDNAFRLAPPALAPAQGDEGGGLKAAAALRRKAAGSGKPDEARVVLDNLAQFRFYSAWRGSLERQRRGSA